MLRPFRSLRFRLMMTFVLVVGVINAVLGGAGIALRDWQLRARFDDRLTLRADRLAAWLEPRLREAPGADTLLDHPSRPFAEEDLYITLRGPSGELLAKSAAMRHGDLPVAHREGGATGNFETLDDEALRDLRGRPERVRVFMREFTLDGTAYTLQVGRDLAEVDESLRYLRSVLWVALPASLLVAGLAGWVVINGALRAIRTVSQTASHISSTHLDERIRVSSGDAEINRLVTELNRMLDRLSESFKAQQRFIANASHALQTPVAALLSQAQVLKSDAATDDDCRRFVASVEEEMRQLTRMMSSMLSLIRMESGELERAQRVISLNDVLVAAVEDVRPAAAVKGVQMHLTLPDPEVNASDPDVVGDAGLLQTMAENLIRSAVQYSPRGGAVDAVLELDDDQAVLTVSDAGPALSDVAIRSVFEREPEWPPTDTARRGDGLTLSMARTIAELHDGTIGVRNRPEGGVAFFVWLPLARKSGG